jgi:hypothetical protein
LSTIAQGCPRLALTLICSARCRCNNVLYVRKVVEAEA